jgi:tetratricopeptide (TPR) repeat protein
MSIGTRLLSVQARRSRGVAKLRSRASALLVAVLLSSLAFIAHGADDVLLKAKSLLDAKNPQAAYNLLAPLQSQRAGDPDYDYLLGVSALDLGKNTEAVFALERVLSVRPDSAPARAQIARAYFALKETDTAKREFENVKKQEVPQDVRRTIDRYLEAIDHITETEKFKARFFVEFALGWDSNVNSAARVDSVAVPSFPEPLTLNSSAIEKHDGFFSVSAGTNISNPLSRGWSLIGGLSGYKRSNFVQDDFGIGYLDSYLGLAKKYERDTWTLVGQGNMFFVDSSTYNSEFRNAVGGTLQWTHDFNARNQVTAYAQYASLTYPEQTPRDANRYIAGIGYAHAFRGGDPIVYLGAYAGAEVAKDSGFNYLGHRPVGLRVGGQKILTDDWLAFFSLAAEWRKYRGNDRFFQVGRDDKQYSAAIGLTYALVNDWKVSPQITYVNNGSNITINEYDRTQLFVTLRRDF